RQGVRFRKFRPRLRYRGGSVGCTILLDIAFILIAFYLVVSPVILKPGIQIELPAAVFNGGVVLGGDVVSITRDERIYFDDEQIDLDRLVEHLIVRVNKEPKLVLIIEADRQVSHGRLVDVWSAAQAAGVQSISLATGLRGEDYYQ
ncbi:MAG: hypothetical protein CMF29_05940, partial [Kiritimatiellaceae bacterium]|nr:hypothetical protein [Kiritimatiellaceae bacterium]